MSEPLLKTFGGAAGKTQSSNDRAVRGTTAITQGRLLDLGAVAATTPTSFRHNLGRIPQGFVVVEVTSAAFPTFRTNSKDRTTLTLEASAAASRVVVWVF